MKAYLVKMSTFILQHNEHLQYTMVKEPDSDVENEPEYIVLTQALF